MRRINAKLLLGLLIGSVFCTGAVFGVHHFQYERIADSLLWQARRAEEQGQVRRQAKYLQRYLEFNPKDLEGKATLAKLWAGDAFPEAGRERVKAVRLLDEVLTRGEDKPELRRLVVKVALEVQMWKMARTHLEKLVTREFLAAPSEPPAGEKAGPERGEVEGYAGQLLEGENQPAKALVCYRLGVVHAPEVRPAYVRLARLLRRMKEVDPDRRRKNEKEADQALDRLVANNPLSFEAYLSRWRYRREYGLISFKKEAADGLVTLKDASADVAEALRRAPESVDVLLAAADLERLEGQALLASEMPAADRDRLRNEHRDRALSYLNQGLKLHARTGKQAALDLMQFQLLWHKGGLLLDDIERLDAARDGDAPADAERRPVLVAEAEQVIEQVRKTRGSAAAADFLRGRLLLQDRRWAEAVTLFEQARPSLGGQPDLANQINLYLGQCYEQLVEPGQMLQAYERLHQGEPNSVAARLGIAQAEWTMGHLDRAAETFRELAVQRRLPDRVWLDYARLEIQRQVRQDKPRWDVVEQVLGYADKANPGAVDVPLTTAQMWVARGEPAKARRLLREAQSKSEWEANVDLWTARVFLELRDKDRKQLEEARTILREAKQKLGDHVVALRLAEARLLAEEQQKEAESGISRLGDDAESFKKADDQAKLLGGLADVQLGLENVQAARELWQRVAKLPGHRTDLPLHLLLFDLAVKADDEAGMRRALDDIRGLEGNQGPFHRYGEALRLMWEAKQRPDGRQKALVEARLHLDRVQSIRPTWPPLFLARARIERMLDHPDQAIANLNKAVEYGERSPTVIRDLVELLAGRERFDEAEAALRYVHEPMLAHSDLGKFAAMFASRRGDNRRAGELLRKNLSPEGTTNYRELLWDGRMLSESNPAEAEKKLRAALRLAEREPEPYLALVQFLVRQKREKEADALLEQARQKLPAARVELTLGQCYEILGRKKSAQARYEEALQGHRQDATVLRRVAGFYWTAGQLAQAEPLLRDLAEGKVKDASPEDVGWGRRHLALVLASGTDYGRFHEALELVGLKLDANGQLARDAEREKAEGTDDRRFQARVLASQSGHRVFRQRAIELMQELERSKALNADDRFILAMLYEAEASWRNAKPLLDSLARGRDPAPRHLAYYVQTLIEHKELEKAGEMVERLEQLEEQRGPDQNAFASVELRARLEEVQGKGEAALARLEKLVSRPKANPAEVLLVLNSMRRQGKFAEAFERCLKTWQEKKCPPEVIGGASVAVLRHMQRSGKEATHAQVLLVENHLKAALQADPKSVVLMLHLADLYDQRGRWEEAEALYRQVLLPENEPKNVVALNNLAWLLAQRASDRQKVEEALARIEAAVNGIGRRADLLDTRGLVYLKLDQNAEALADFREASADMPTPAHLFHLARAHQQARDKAGAYKALKQAKENGLQASALHPVEHDAYQRLLRELNVN